MSDITRLGWSAVHERVVVVCCTACLPIPYPDFEVCFSYPLKLLYKWINYTRINCTSADKRTDKACVKVSDKDTYIQIISFHGIWIPQYYFSWDIVLRAKSIYAKEFHIKCIRFGYFVYKSGTYTQPKNNTYYVDRWYECNQTKPNKIIFTLA